MSSVSRSVYQKLKEENKRLLADIKILVEDGMPSDEYFKCVLKWQDKFRKEADFNAVMKRVCKQYIKDHAEELPEFLTRNIEKQ